MALTEEWKRTVADGIANTAWDAYDPTIRSEVDEYNRRLARTPGYALVDWKVPKAILWVESGGPSNPAWRTRPMQIGNPGDPAYGVLKAGKEGADLIVSDQLKRDIKGNINDPKLNVRAGVAYLFTRMAQTDLESVVDPTDTKTFAYTVGPGDSLDRIATKVGSTLEVLRKLNPTATVLQPKQTIVCQKASIKRVVKGWLRFDTTTIARRYNVGDPSYAAKLDHVLSLFPKLKR